MPSPVGFAASTNWLVERLGVSDLRCVTCVECESGAYISAESAKTLIACLPGLARNLAHVRSSDRRCAGSAILSTMALLAITGAFPNRLAAQTLAKLDLSTIVVLAPRPDARSEKPRDSCADPFEFRPVSKRLVSHSDDRDSQAEQGISSCGIRGDALGSGVLGIAVVFNSEFCLLPIKVAKEIISTERLLLCRVERDEAVQRRLGESHSADSAGERKGERDFRFGRRR